MKSWLLTFVLMLTAAIPIPGSNIYAEAPSAIRVPPLKPVQNLRDIYKTDGTPQVLMVIHFPKGPGNTFIELYNHTKRNISIFQFSLHSVGQSGDLSFEDLPAGWSGVKETAMNNIREFTVIQPRAIDDNAVEFYPKLVVHYEIGLQKPVASGGKKKIGK